jgi:HK97 gp10 family phage protein
MPAGVDIIWNPVEFAKLHYDPLLLAQIEHDTEPVVRAAQSAAPKATGAGAASIRAEARLTDLSPGVAVSWDRDHFYMYFMEKGTRYLAARPFLVPAVDRYL